MLEPEPPSEDVRRWTDTHGQKKTYIDGSADGSHDTCDGSTEQNSHMSVVPSRMAEGYIDDAGC